MVPSKEYLYIDRGDTVSPLNFYLCLFLDGQASLEKNPIMNYELLLGSVFELFMGKKISVA